MKIQKVKASVQPPRLNDEFVELYRGVSREIHDDGEGLQSRNGERPFIRQVSYDGSWKSNGAVTYGNPTSQAVHAHQRDSEEFNGPGVSFSASESVARRFATTNGVGSGIVYVARRDHLIAIGCSLFYPPEHTRALQNPGELEVVVVPPYGTALTMDCVVRVIEVP